MGFDRVVDYCDGWLPIALRGDMRADMEQLKAAADRADRDFDTINRTVSALDLTRAGPGPDRHRFQRIIFGLPPQTPGP